MYQKMFNPNTVFNVVSSQVVPASDPSYVAWLANGNAPFEPIQMVPTTGWQVSIRRLVAVLIQKGVLAPADFQ